MCGDKKLNFVFLEFEIPAECPAVNVEKTIGKLQIEVWNTWVHLRINCIKKIGKAHENGYSSKINVVINFLQNTLGYNMYL